MLFLLFLSGIVPAVFPALADGSPAGTRGRGTIVVNATGGGDYATIQEALDASNDLDTIYVEPGTYYENPVIARAIDLIGSGRDRTYIVSDASDVITIRSDGVFVKSFNITSNNSNSEGAGILIDNVDDCRLENNTIYNKSTGIFLNRTQSIILINNFMRDNGIIISGNTLQNWDTHTIDTSNTVNDKMIHYWKNQTGGKIPDNAGQIIITDCGGVLIEDQNVSNTNVGIDISFSRGGIEVRNNICGDNNHYGINVVSSSQNTIEDNVCNSNLLSGIRLNGYCGNCNDNIISDNHCDSNGKEGILLQGSLDGTNCLGNEILNNTCNSNTRYGIHLDHSDGNTLEDNDCDRGRESGIYLGHSDGNVVTRNDCSNSTGHGGSGAMILANSERNEILNNTCRESIGGIYLQMFSNGNNIYKNTCELNDEHGIYLYLSNSNTIDNNTLISNDAFGINVSYLCEDNYLHHNVLIGNNEGGAQAADYGEDNLWNTSRKGNYWSDWSGPDIDDNGIVDEPYNIHGPGDISTNSKDHLPLVEPPGIDILFASAGNDVSVDQHQAVNFDGTGSWGYPNITNFTWSFNYNSTNTILYEPTPAFTFHKAGTYAVLLTVSNEAQNRDTDEMIVEVWDIEVPVPFAGEDTVIDRGDTYIFNGSGCSDNTRIDNYTWNFTYNNTEIILYGISPAFSFLLPGRYHITLGIYDPRGNRATDAMVLVVKELALPVAGAGEDITINQHESVRFDGSGSITGSGSLNYTWNFSYNLREVILYGMVADHIFDEPGMYHVTLNITDDTGKWAKDTLVVTVIDIYHPIAMPGSNITISQGDKVLFDGSGSFDNVGIINYTWRFSYNGTIITLRGKNVSFTFNIAGEYIVTLTVSDIMGNTAKANMTITVSERDGDDDPHPDDDEPDDNETEKDSDGDGYNDTFENQSGSDPYDPISIPDDWDGDGVPNEKDAYPRDPDRWKKEGSNLLFVIIYLSIGLILLVASIVAYTRLKRRNILNNKKRREIVEYINEHPGDHYREIKRQLDMSSGTLRHHLRTLENASMIRSHREGKYLYYFPYGTWGSIRVLTPAQKDIIDVIQKQPGATTREIADGLGKSRRAIQHHVNDLSDIDIIKSESIGKSPGWHVTEDVWGKNGLT